jgi:Uncharacterised nucleotidyltransferase
VVEVLPSSLEWERLATNLRVEAALLEALDVLQGFSVIVFKGAILTRLIYGDLRARASSDNDIWIPASEASAALDRLLEAGFLPAQGIDARAAVRRVGQVALWPNGDTERPSLDLHLAPFSSRYFSVREEVLNGNLLAVDIHQREVLTFSRPLAMTHLVAHYIQHHFEDDHLKDLGAAWDSWQPILGGIMALAAQTCTKEALLFTLHRTYQLGHCRIPPPAPLYGRSRIVTAVVDKPGFGHPLGRKFLSLFLTSPRRLPEGAWGSVFLEQDDLDSRYGVGTPWRQYWRHLRYLLER